MFKRIERKRKRREEEEDLGLDEDTKEIMGLNDTDSDESDLSSESEQDSAPSDPGINEDADDDDDEISDQEEGFDESPPISVEDALKDPIYALPSDPIVYGCVLCKGKLIENAAAASAHRNAKVHKRRFQRFELLSGNADPGSDAWELVRATQATSGAQASKSHELSNRALKRARQARQAVIREKRKRHKELKAKAIAKKASERQLANGKTRPGTSPKERSQNVPGKVRKKPKLESSTMTTSALDVAANPPARTKDLSDNKRSRIKGARGANRSS